MKRATRFPWQKLAKILISIHALVKRATDEHLDPKVFDAISIHALVKRATQCYTYFDLYRLDFNPRPREEGDYISPVE